MTNKAQDAYKTINEVSELLDVPQHVLRFWEKKFDQISPCKINGRRYYTKTDIDLISNIKFLLYSKGFTIPGVVAYLAEGKDSYAKTLSADSVAALENLREGILSIKARLKSALEE